MEKEQSAVEWQFEQLFKAEKDWAKEVINGMQFIERKYEILAKAKEMEKEEKVKFALKVYLEKRQTHGGDIMQIADKLVNL